MDNTVEDFWRMISQYDIGTVVMLNSLREGKEVILWFCSLAVAGSSASGGMLMVFYYSMASSSFPDPWKLAKVNAIPKKGSPADVSNYRPISLLTIPVSYVYLAMNENEDSLIVLAVYEGIS